MNKTKYYILIFFFSSTTSIFAQKMISGKVIDDSCEDIIEAKIFNKDTVLLGETDMNGKFTLKVNENLDTLIFAYVGYEWATITFSNSCNYFEVILIPSSTYDFMSNKKIDKLRKKGFNKLPDLHKEAKRNGIFLYDTMCYERRFEPIKPELDKIKKRNIQIKKQIENKFRKLVIGDTICIPFSSMKGYDGTNRSSLFPFSSYSDELKFDVEIKGVITSKNKRKNGYNITYRVIDYGNNNIETLIYQNKDIKNGEIFEHNMKIYKVISN